MSASDESSFYRAKFKFIPETKVEIPLEIGDIVLVLLKHKSGWYKGKLVSTKGEAMPGIIGYFPGSYCVESKFTGIVKPDMPKLGRKIGKRPDKVPARDSPRPPRSAGTVRPKARKSSGAGPLRGGTSSIRSAVQDLKSDSDPIGSRNRMKFNSTTTMMTVDSTISKPNKKMAIQGVAAMIVSKVLKGSRYRSAFDENSDMKIFNSKSYSWKHPFKPKEEPSVEAIQEFITVTYKEGRLEVDSIITCYLYVERIVMCGLPLTRRNVRPVVFTAMLLASKVWDDMSMWNCDFATIFDELDDKTMLAKINEWESSFLNGIQFNVLVTAKQYTEMYFKLREFHATAKILLVPLKQQRAQQLEALTEAALNKLKAKLEKLEKSGAKIRSMTLDGGAMPSLQAILD